jgi:hypothetical protein
MMTQIKFTIESDIVSAFKARCTSKGVSMTAVIRKWMSNLQPTIEVGRGACTRSKRRKAVVEIVGLLSEVLEMEEQYRDSIPEQFTQRYEWADHACEHISEAIAALEEAFCP